MFCPNCKTHYQATQSMCPDCFADLVEESGDWCSVPVESPPQEATEPTQRQPEPPTRREAPKPPQRPQSFPPPPAQVRPAGRIHHPPASTSGDLFTWGVAAALMLGLGVGGWRLAHRAAGSGPAVSTAGADLPSADRSLAEARRCLAQGSYGDAAREARLALTLLGPQAGQTATRPAREVLAQALLKSQDYEQATEQYKLLASYFPEDKSYTEALQQARSALTVGRKAEAEATWQQARQSFAARRYREAADQADQAAIIYASLPDGSRQRIECRRLAAQAHARQGTWRSALYAWSEVLQARPRDAVAQAGLAEAERHLQSSEPVRVVYSNPVRRPVSQPVAVQQQPPAPVGAQPAYPTAKSKKDEFYASETPSADEPPPRRQRPERPPTPGGGEEDPYADGPPPPSGGPEEGPPPQLPPTGPPAAAPRPQLPRLPSLTYPGQAQGNGIPGYTPVQRNNGGYNSLPGYYSEKGRQNTGGGIPGL